MQKKSIDTTLVFAVLGLMIFGMVMISSVSVYSSYDLTAKMVNEGRLSEISNAFFLTRTIAHVFVGILMLVIFSKIPYTIYEKWVPHVFGAMIIVMFGVLFFGDTRNGATGWIDIPGLPSIQPVEFMKLALIMMLAYFIKRRKTFLADWKKGILPFALYVGLTLVLLMAQPDYGSILIITPVVVLMYFA